jgi:hypothetical protein
VVGFYKPDTTTFNSPTVPNIVAAEYSLDTDPGFGNGTPINIGAASTEISTTFSPSISNLSVGFHFLYVRGKDSKGIWSQNSIVGFYKPDTTTFTSPTVPDVVAAEYFIDSDPGEGNRISIPFSPGIEVQPLFTLDLASVSIGQHQLYIRGKDSNGNWGRFSSATFTKQVPPTISSVSRDSGAVGAIITIRGTNFSPIPSDNIVKFDTAIAVVTLASSDSMQVRVPNLSSAFVPVTLTIGGTTITVLNNFRVIGPVVLPILTISAASVGFGQVAVGDSVRSDLTIRNATQGNLTINSATIQSQNFSLSPLSLPRTLQFNSSLDLTFFFRPKSFGLFRDTLRLNSNGGLVLVSMSGTSPVPLALLGTNQLKFDTLRQNVAMSRTLVITNSSINALRVDSARTRTNQFTISGTTFPRFVNRGDTLRLIVTALINSITIPNDTLFLATNAEVNSINVPLIVDAVLSAKEVGSDLPKLFVLDQNYPNPFNPATTIQYQLPFSSEVKLVVYDMLGRAVQTLVNTRQNAGSYQATFNSSNLSSGVYFYKLQAGSFNQTKKMLLIK